MILSVVFTPLVMGLLCLLLKRGQRLFTCAAYLVTAVIGAYTLLQDVKIPLHLVGSFGVSLQLDRAAGWFLLLNALVSAAVTWHASSGNRRGYFFILLVMLHGCMNACFVSMDLFNLYVVIELTTIIAFLLVGQGMTTRHLWNALRYLFLSNIGMLFFLLGTLLVYESAGNFALASVSLAPPTARALIVTGLLVKSGVFLPGLWLPQAHAEAEAAVSALLSGVVVNIGLLPLLRLAACTPDLEAILRLTGFGGIFTGLAVAFFQRDIKRLLACSTISQMGFAMISPAFGALYAFSHGTAKAALFLCTTALPDRDLVVLRVRRIEWPVAWLMSGGALSIAGMPLLLGFFAKYQVTSAIPGWVRYAAALAAVGTAALMTPIILMPLRTRRQAAPDKWQPPALLIAVLLLSGLAAGPYTATAWIKSIATLAAGMLMHAFVFRRLIGVSLPDEWEKLEHVVGMTCITLIIIIVAVYIP